MLALKPQILAFIERDASAAAAVSAQPRASVQAMLAAVRVARPGAQPTTVTMEAAPTSAVSVALGRDGIVYVDPHTARVPALCPLCLFSAGNQPHDEVKFAVASGPGVGRGYFPSCVVCTGRAALHAAIHVCASLSGFVCASLVR